MIVHGISQTLHARKEVVIARSGDADRSTGLSAAVSRGRARTDLAARFRHAGIDNPDLDARLLVCAACGIDHAGLIRDPDVPLGAAAADTLASHEGRRLAGEPVSRILGRREFWGLPFAVTPAVLDPRPETEGLVAAVLDAIGGRRPAPLEILDIGVGSGAILAALLHELPGARGVGVDRSQAACRVAHRNLQALGLADRALIVCGHWTEAVAARFDIVVSNPPYITAADLDGLAPEVRDHDPQAALDGGGDGLDAYRAIVPCLPALLRPAATAAFECGAGQGDAVSGLMRAANFADVAVYRDLAGLDRVVIGSSPA